MKDSVETLAALGFILVVFLLLLLFGVAFIYMFFPYCREEITNDFFGDHTK